MTDKLSQQRVKAEVARWNQEHSVGTPVTLCVPTKTAGEAHLFGDRAVVPLDGLPGFYPLTAVRVGHDAEDKP